MRSNIKKDIGLLKAVAILSMLLFFTSIQTAIAGTVETGMTTNSCDGKMFMGSQVMAISGHG